jgi:hypothetical protein
VDRHTLLRNDDFPINIKRLLDDDFLVEFFFGLPPSFGLYHVSGHAG